MDPSCPEPRQLLGLLDGTLPEEDQAGLTNHIAACRQCQRDLEELAGGTEWLADKKPHLGEETSPKESALREVEEILKGEAPEGHTPDCASTAHVSLDFLDPPETPGHLGRLGGYDVIEVVGSGGMGVVLKAFEPSLNRAVAIKVLSPSLASNATARRRFIREAQAAAAVSHDHVVTIHAVDEANGLPYLVMQYVSGMSLEEKIAKSGPLELKEVLRIGMQAASGLAAAHAQGLIHRDIKPANLLLENGVERVKITDFGLARAVDDASMTESGVVAGTPQYMAPEQARGDSVDHRADLFSLGSVLFAMATGRPPFRSSQTLAVLRRIADETPPSILELNPELPAWLADVVARLHANDPDVRFQSAEEVSRVLGAHLARLQQPSAAGVLLDAKRPAPEQAGSGGRGGFTRRRWLAAAIAVLVLAGGLSITEATDVTAVTEYVATVLRIRTPHGTLVVKVDDPDIEVAVEGDGETVTLRGAGAHEIRLSPGRHKIEATRQGRQIATEWATITRGGKEVVTVNFEGELDADETGTEPAPDGRPAIHGRAYLGDPSHPAAHQKLWLYDAEAMEIHRHLRVGEGGNFTSGPLPDGEYFLLAKMIDGRTGQPTPFFVQSRPFYLYGEEPPRVDLDLLSKSRLEIGVAEPFVDRVQTERRTVKLGIRFSALPNGPRLPTKPDPLAEEPNLRVGVRSDGSYRFGPFPISDFPRSIAVPPGNYSASATVGDMEDFLFTNPDQSRSSFWVEGGNLSRFKIPEGQEVELRYTLPKQLDEERVRTMATDPKTKVERLFATLEKVTTRKLPDVAAITSRSRESPRYAGRTLREWLALLETERKPELVMDAIRAVVVLRKPGLEREVAEAIFKLMRPYNLERINKDAEGEMIQLCIDEFRKLDSDAALDVLRDGFKNDNESDRRFALWVLRQGGRDPIIARAREVVPAILEASRDDDPLLRAWAINSAVLFGSTVERVVPRLREALRDSHDDVIAAASHPLVSLAPDTEGLVEALLVLAKKKDSPHRTYAIEDLSRLGPRVAPAVPGLIELLRELLPPLPDAEAVNQRQRHLQHLRESREDNALRASIVKLLGEIGPAAKEAIPQLEIHRTQDIFPIRDMAFEAIKKIKGDEGTPTESPKEIKQE